MSNKDKQELNSQAVPFFGRYLEGQLCEDGGGSVTEKYPSDNEEGSDPMTRKFPSDNEEDDSPVTLKYPSDNEDVDGIDRDRLPTPEGFIGSLILLFFICFLFL